MKSDDYEYRAIWLYPKPLKERPLIRVKVLDIESYKGNGVWVASDDLYGGIFYGDIENDVVTKATALEIMKYHDKRVKKDNP